jgi:hypothetical protein
MRDAMSVLIRPVVSEKSYGLMDKNVYVFIVDPRRHQDRRPPRRGAGLRRAGHQRQHLNRKGKATRNRRTNIKGTAPTPSAPSSPSIPTTPSISSIADHRIAPHATSLT